MHQGNPEAALTFPRTRAAAVRAPTRPATLLLELLQRVKPTGPGRWLALCPAHEDRSPSLSIREKEDGTLLIHCFAGCGAVDILDTLGLPWQALFPGKSTHWCPYSGSQSRISPRDLIEIISLEVTTVALVAADMLAGKTLTETDWKRLAQAAARIGKARDHLK